MSKNIFQEKSAQKCFIAMHMSQTAQNKPSTVADTTQRGFLKFKLNLTHHSHEFICGKQDDFPSNSRNKIRLIALLTFTLENKGVKCKNAMDEAET